MAFVVVGTAGHVDHGKTVLVRALTGVDTDRLKEEKERGISIELGFAPFVLPDGQVAGLVDVPGHERFIRQMLAGAAGIDLVLLVVAADEGVMPQTREHLAIVDLLQVKGGVIAITKKDLVGDDWLELVAEEVREAVKGTVLEHAPLVAVSALTGEGLDLLRRHLAEQAKAVVPRPATGSARLPIDRVFTVRGFGTVVTGTLWSGALRAEEVVSILPQEVSARIRQLQVHNRRVNEAYAGQRVACNLAGVEVGQVDRGSVLVEPGTFRPTRRLDVQLRLLPGAREVRRAQRVRFYLGTAEVFGRVLLLDRETLAPGEITAAQLSLEEPVIAARGDRFVLRSYSPMTTIGGGLVVEPYATRHKPGRPEVLAELAQKLSASPAERALQILERRTWGLPLAELALLAGLPSGEAEAVAQVLAAEGRVLVLSFEGGKYLVTTAQAARWQQEARVTLEQYHRRYHLRRGMSREELRSRRFAPLPARVFSSLLEHWQAQGLIVDRGGSLALKDFTPRPSTAEQEKLAAIGAAIREGGWQPPAVEELWARLGLDAEEGEELVRYLVQEGLLVKVSEGLYFSQEAVAQAKERVAALIQARGSVELAAVRDALGSSRKYVLPLLEYFDQIHFTKRIGDKRVLYGSSG